MHIQKLRTREEVPMSATMQKLIVEVVEARNLLPKDGHGTSSPYVAVDYYGQRKRTRTAVRELSPTWNEPLEFDVGMPSEVFDDVLELNVFHDKTCGQTRRNIFLGRLRLSSSQFVKKGEEALIYFPLEKKHLFSWVQGDIGLKIYYADVVDVPPPPTPPPEPESKPPEPAPPPPAPEAANHPEKPEPAEGEKQGGDSGVKEGEAEVKDGDKLPEPPQGSPPPPPPPPPVEHTVDAMQRDRYEMEAVAGQVKFTGPQPIRRPISGGGFSRPDHDPSEIVTPIERSSFDLVEKMHYVFVRVVRARSLPTNGSPVVKISVSKHHVRSKPARKTAFFDWDQTFAFSRDSPESSSILEISVWDSSDASTGRDDFLGGICLDAAEIPLRDPPDSPLAPQWYRLEGGRAHHGDLMLATWVGTQADESFPDAWKTDTAGNPNARAKIYQSPKLWYLRATVLEAQDVALPATTLLKDLTLQIKAQLGFQALKTRPAVAKNGAPSWNEDLLFVAAEPFNEHLVFTLETRSRKGPPAAGSVAIPLAAVERRVDDRTVASRWFNVEKKGAYGGRLHLRLCFDGGYHVMDEAANASSDYRPTARQLWKPPLGTVELGIVGCKNLVPVKHTVAGKGCTDAYVVAKYGPKWVRTRTVSDSLDPKWNEQYTFKVFDPCTVLTIGVFDSWEGCEIDGEKDAARPDFRIGKVRVRISTLAMGKVHRNTYPLQVLTPVGMKKMGEIEIAVRFLRAGSRVDLLHAYSQPLMPPMHHLKPLGLVQQDQLRAAAVKIVAAHLARSEPPVRPEVVVFMLDADSQTFSMRKLRANYLRIVNVAANVIDAVHWVDNTRTWKNPTATMLVHALLVMLVWFPDLIIPTLAFYVFAIGAWNYRLRTRDSLPHFDPKLSLAEAVDRDELEEEFDPVPSCKPPDEVRARYDKLRMFGAKLQTALGDLATQGERVQALVTWRDPCATGIFVGFCFVLAMIMYLVPSKMVAMASGFYYFRHPIFRDRMPSPVLNFFRRLPSLSDRIM